MKKLDIVCQSLVRADAASLISGGTGLGVPGESSQPHGLVEGGLTLAGNTRSGLEQEEAGKLLLGQLVDWGGGNLAEISTQI